MASSRFEGFSVVFACVVVCVLGSSVVSDDEVIVCPNSCSECQCCTDLRTDTFQNLHVKFNCSSPGVSEVVEAPGSSRNATFRLFLSNQCLTRLPQNICDFPNIVSIRMTGNLIEDIPSLSCVTNLIALDLSDNRIETIKRETFSGLRRLRYINLGSNRIRTIETRTFVPEMQSLMVVLLGGNQLRAMEAAWPMSIKHDFCLFDLNHNNLTHFSNEEGWMLNEDESYGPGMVDFTYNSFTKWFTPQLKIYGITEMRMLSKFIGWGFDLRYNPWACDCKLFEFSNLLSNIFKVMWRQYFQVFCQSPPELKGTLILDVSPNDLVCNITEKCPSECFCQDQPAHGQMLVDCTNQNLDRLPYELPPGNIKLLVRNNSIDTIEPRSFLSRTHYMDISNNGLRNISSVAMGMLRSVGYLNLSHNHLIRLPENVVNIPLSRLSLTNNPLVCDCQTTWMTTWLKHQFPENNVPPIVCLAGGKYLVPGTKADYNFLKCEKVDPFPTVLSVIFGVLSMIFVGILALIVMFRYEVALLLYISLDKLHRKTDDDSDHDLFVSFEDDSDVDRQWGVRTLIPEMEKQRDIKLYFPPRDMDPGSVTMDETIKILKCSRAALVLLTSDYLNSSSKLFEFSQAFKIMIKQRRGRLIILKSKETEVVKRGYLRAMLRLNKYLDLEDDNIFDNIKQELDMDGDTVKETATRSPYLIKVVT